MNLKEMVTGFLTREDVQESIEVTIENNKKPGFAQSTEFEFLSEEIAFEFYRKYINNVLPLSKISKELKKNGTDTSKFVRFG